MTKREDYVGVPPISSPKYEPNFIKTQIYDLPLDLSFISYDKRVL